MKKLLLFLFPLILCAQTTLVVDPANLPTWPVGSNNIPISVDANGRMIATGTGGGGGGSGTVTSVAETFTGGLISISGSPITTSGTFALSVAGTNGGIPYFSSSSTWASSAALSANALMIGGGAGAAPATSTTGTGVLTALGANVGSAGAFVTFNGALGTPSSGTATNLTGLPISTGVSGLGTGVATALAVNTGSAGAFVLFNGALGTPSSGTLTNATGLPISTGVSGLGTGVATFLGTPSSANLISAVTDESGSGVLIFGTSPAFTTSVTTGSTTFAVFNTTATTVNAFGGASTALNIGNASGATAMLGILGVDGATPSSSTALITPASTTAVSSLRVPHGSAPTSPVNGDLWTTTSGVFARINGSTIGPLAAGGSGTVSSGTTNTLAKYTAATTVGNSAVTDDGTTLTYSGTGGIATSGSASGILTLNGVTSGKTIYTTADATAQTVTVNTAAQTSGAATITIPDMAGVSDTFDFLGKAQTFTAVKTFSSATNNSSGVVITPAAYTSGANAHVAYQSGADTGLTAATEARGWSWATATRTWATTGTVANQREYHFAGVTYASASPSQTFTDVSTLSVTQPIQGTNAVLTRPHSLQLVDSTSAASSITGGLVVATTLGTTGTSVGIGGGNINAGGTGTFGGAVTATNFVGTFAGNTFTTGTGVLTLGAGKTTTFDHTSTFTTTDAAVYTFPAATATIARTDAGQTFTGVQNFTSPDITTSVTTSSTSFTAFAGATTLLTIGGTGASASLLAPSTLDATTSTTGAIRTSGGISAAKAMNVGTTLTVAGHLTFEGVTSTGATGTGLLVFGTSPTLTTAVLGSSTATTQSAGDASTKVSTTAYADRNSQLQYNAQTGTTYTLVLADGTPGSSTAGVSMSNASANTLTVPTNASVAFPTGWTIPILNLGVGTTTIAAAGGVTINAPGSNLTIGTTYGSGVLNKTGTNTWQWYGASLPAVVASGRVTAQSAANSSIATYTVGAADSSFNVSANMEVSASTTLVTTLTCTYTDESNTARTMIFPVSQLSGSFIAAGAITGTGAWETPVMHIRCKTATAITILTSTGTFTGVTYTAEGVITQTR